MGGNTLTKECTVCKEHKSLGSFGNNRTKKDGKQSVCRECSKTYSKRHNPDLNKNRMTVNGKYVSRKHPLWKPGNYKLLDDTFFFMAKEEKQATTEGYVYIISNPAWPGVVKVGMAQNPLDRLATFQTYSPARDYQVEHVFFSENYVKAETKAHKTILKKYERAQGEWFKCTPKQAKELLEKVL